MELQPIFLFSFILKIAGLMVGSLLTILGYKLFIKGVYIQSGNIEASAGNYKLTLQNAAPGTIAFLFGSIIIGFCIFKGLPMRDTVKEYVISDSVINSEKKHQDLHIITKDSVNKNMSPKGAPFVNDTMTKNYNNHLSENKVFFQKADTKKTNEEVINEVQIPSKNNYHYTRYYQHDYINNEMQTIRSYQKQYEAVTPDQMEEFYHHMFIYDSLTKLNYPLDSINIMYDQIFYKKHPKQN